MGVEFRRLGIWIVMMAWWGGLKNVSSKGLEKWVWQWWGKMRWVAAATRVAAAGGGRGVGCGRATSVVVTGHFGGEFDTDSVRSEGFGALGFLPMVIGQS